jgi:RecA-family ATPase
MDKLAPKLIRRAAKKNYIAIIIDPIYKVITGDENSANQMAHFCNQFDKVCTELNSAVIYCHHHSKGSQGAKKSMDRSSGSGVFARDPDALLDLIELEVTDALKTQEVNKAICGVCEKWLDKLAPNYEDYISQDDLCNQNVMIEKCKKLLRPDDYKAMQKDLFSTEAITKKRTAWRIEGTLREFPQFDPVNLWFDYPVHHVDRIGSLKDVGADGEAPSWKRNFKKKKSPDDVVKERKTSLETAYEACGFNGKVTIQGLAEYMGITEKTVRNRIKEHGGFWIDGGNIGKK